MQEYATWRSPLPLDPSAKKHAMIWSAVVISVITMPLAIVVDWRLFAFAFIILIPMVWPIGMWAERKAALKTLRQKLLGEFDPMKDPFGLPATIEAFSGMWFIGSDAGVISFQDNHRLVFNGLRCSFELIRQDIESSGDGTYVVMDEHFKRTDLSFRVRPFAVPDANEYPNRPDLFAKQQEIFLRSGKKREQPSVLPPREAFSSAEIEASDPFLALGLVFTPVYFIQVLLRLLGVSADTAFLLMLTLYCVGVGIWVCLYKRSRQRAIVNVGSSSSEADS